MKRSGWYLIPVLAGSLFAAQPEKSAAENGESTYRQKCGGCHGLDGKAESTMGKTWKMRDLTSPGVQKQSDQELLSVIANGRGHMPAYEMILGNDKIHEVISYIRELGKK
jgi:mono/diheme cytochrome c family protein